MKLNKYPDGTSYISDTQLGDKVFRVNTYEDLWHLNQFVDSFHSKHGLTPSITIPNLLDAQADRRFSVDESFGLKLVLKFLAGLDANFKIFHPHNPEVVEMAFEVLGKKVVTLDNTTFIKDVLNDLYLDFLEEGTAGSMKDHLIMMSSDAGGFKPLMKLCDKLTWDGETYSASKSRKYEDGKSKLVQLVDRQDFGGKDILIVDDMCLGGGTFIGLAKMLRERNCGKLFLAVSHMTLPKPNPELFEVFDKVYTTNSKGLDYLIPGGEQGHTPTNLEIMNIF
jgi:ribose-phosphate pyrophosphokinase